MHFINISPNSFSLTPSNTLTPETTTISSSSSKRKKDAIIHAGQYYYSLKNDNSYSYLIIQYIGFSGEYLEIESTRAN